MICRKGFRKAIFCAQSGTIPIGIEDRRREEKQLRGELPDLPDVTKTNVQRRQQQPQPDAEHVKLEEQRRHEQPLDPRRDALDATTQ